MMQDHSNLQSPELARNPIDVPKDWPKRPELFENLLTPVEAAMFLRLDQTGHCPKSALRTLIYWRDRGELKATKYARRVWYLKEELILFLKNKTED